MFTHAKWNIQTGSIPSQVCKWFTDTYPLQTCKHRPLAKEFDNQYLCHCHKIVKLVFFSSQKLSHHQLMQRLWRTRNSLWPIRLCREWGGTRQLAGRVGGGGGKVSRNVSQDWLWQSVREVSWQWMVAAASLRRLHCLQRILLRLSIKSFT